MLQRCVFIFLSVYQGQWVRKNRKYHLKNMCSSFEYTFCEVQKLNVYKSVLKVAYVCILFSILDMILWSRINPL